MRRCISLALALALMTVTESPSAAAVATIVTTAPLSDHREPSVNAALHAALKAAVVGAAAMGLTWVRISQAVVLEDAVAVKIFATDTAPEPGAEEDGPDPNGGSSADVLEPAGLAL